MKIKNMRRVENMGTLKAFFSVEVEVVIDMGQTEPLDINDCRLVAGRNGLFASLPSRKYIDKKTGQEKYQPINFAGVELIKMISRAAQVEYGGPSVHEQDIPF